MLLSEELVENIFITAVEGGSNYWYLIKDDLPELSKPLPESSLAEKWFHAIVKDGYSLPIYDFEDEGDLLGHVTKENMLKALEKIKEDFSNTWSAFTDETYDCEDADIFFQLTVMNEVQFG